MVSDLVKNYSKTGMIKQNIRVVVFDPIQLLGKYELKEVYRAVFYSKLWVRAIFLIM